jgi:hypothetical protein
MTVRELVKHLHHADPDSDIRILVEDPEIPNAVRFLLAIRAIVESCNISLSNKIGESQTVLISNKVETDEW